MIRKGTLGARIHAWTTDSAVFDETNLISAAGLVPVLALAEQTGQSAVLDAHVPFTTPMPAQRRTE